MEKSEFESEQARAEGKLSQAEMEGIAARLEQLNGIINEGRGSLVVKDVVMYLRNGDLRSARTRAYIDGDKLGQYELFGNARAEGEEIRNILNEELRVSEVRLDGSE